MEYKARLNAYKISVPDLRLYFSIKLMDARLRDFYPYMDSDVIVNVKKDYDRRNTSQNRRLWKLINDIAAREVKKPQSVYEGLLAARGIENIKLSNVPLEIAKRICDGWERDEFSGYRSAMIENEDGKSADIVLSVGTSKMSHDEFEKLIDEAQKLLDIQSEE